MLLRRVVIALDWMLDTALLVLFILLFLIGGYTMYDTWFVYEHAQDTSILAYKPQSGTAAEEVAPISEDAVAWLTIDDTNIDYPVMQGVDNVGQHLSGFPQCFGFFRSLFSDLRTSHGTWSHVWGAGQISGTQLFRRPPEGYVDRDRRKDL